MVAAPLGHRQIPASQFSYYIGSQSPPVDYYSCFLLAADGDSLVALGFTHSQIQ